MPPNPPIKPNEEDCCNSGCNPCIFDVYERKLQMYEKLKKTNVEDCNNYINNGILEIEYTTFIISSIIQVSSSIIILKFKKLPSNKYTVWWNPGDHFLIKYTSPDKTCSRPYTPINLQKNHFKEYDFLIAVKRYDNGLVSNYLFNLKVGDETFWRGPYGFYKKESNKYSRIIMIAQGIGIAPFLSIINDILSNEDDMTRISLFLCCKNIDEILFRNDLYEYNSYWNFSYTVFLSSDSRDIYKKIRYEEPLVNKKFVITDLDHLKPLSADQILLCGSEKFMQEYKNLLDTESENIVLF